MVRQTEKIRAAIVGGSGYTGGELLRILEGHPKIQVDAVTSRKQHNRSVSKVHPNLRGKTDLKFIDPQELSRKTCQLDILFLSTPHGESMKLIDDYYQVGKIVDLSADFRLKSADDYQKWYGKKHLKPHIFTVFKLFITLRGMFSKSSRR